MYDGVPNIDLAFFLEVRGVHKELVNSLSLLPMLQSQLFDAETLIVEEFVDIQLERGVVRHPYCSRVAS